MEGRKTGYEDGGKNEWWHVDIKEKSVAGFSLK